MEGAQVDPVYCWTQEERQKTCSELLINLYHRKNCRFGCQRKQGTCSGDDQKLLEKIARRFNL